MLPGWPESGRFRFRRIAQSLYVYLEDCDLGGYNIVKFDVPVLIREFARAGLQFTVENRRIVDAYHLFCKMEPRTLSAAYKLLFQFAGHFAYPAEADTLATVAVFEAELDYYSRLPKEEIPEGVEFARDLDVIHKLSNPVVPGAIDPEGKFRWKGDEAVVGFGRNSGIPLRQIATENPEFLRWIIRSDFSKEVKQIAQNALKGFFPEKKQEI